MNWNEVKWSECGSTPLPAAADKRSNDVDELGEAHFHLQKGGDKQSPQVQTVQIATSTGQQAQIITRFPSNVIQAMVDKYNFFFYLKIDKIKKVYRKK